MSQQDAQDYRSNIRTVLAREFATHDPATCSYCSAGAVCLELTYAGIADDVVERRMLRRRPGGPS